MLQLRLDLRRDLRCNLRVVILSLIYAFRWSISCCIASATAVVRDAWLAANLHIISVFDQILIFSPKVFLADELIGGQVKTVLVVSISGFIGDVVVNGFLQYPFHFWP